MSCVAISAANDKYAVKVPNALAISVNCCFFDVYVFHDLGTAPLYTPQHPSIR